MKDVRVVNVCDCVHAMVVVDCMWWGVTSIVVV